MRDVPDDVDCDRVIPCMASSLFSFDEIGRREYYDQHDRALEEIREIIDNHFRGQFSDLTCTALEEVDVDLLWKAGEGEADSKLTIGCWLILVSDNYDEEGTLRADGLLLLAEVAESGNALAQWMMGERYSRMNGGLEEGIHQLGLAASGGVVQAANRLQKLYERLYPMRAPKDDGKWKHLFAKSGLIEAQFDYATWLNLNNHYDEGFEWMLKAANAGHETAQEQVALFYEIADADEQAARLGTENPPLEIQKTETTEQADTEQPSTSLDVFSDEELLRIATVLGVKANSQTTDDKETTAGVVQPEEEEISRAEPPETEEVTTPTPSPYSIIRPSRPYQPFNQPLTPPSLPIQPPEIPQPSLIPEVGGLFSGFRNRLAGFLRQITGQ
jgi:TPR repeat protein